MPTLVAPEELATWQPLVDAKSIFLFLDFDGTLAEIAPGLRTSILLSSEDNACKICSRLPVYPPRWSAAGPSKNLSG